MRPLSVGRPVWFRTEERPLFGWLSAPDDERARGLVVVCNPLGSECDNAQVAFESLAEDLVAAGAAVLRFDYDGTGDSAGSWTDGDRIGAWKESVCAAVAFGRATVAGPVVVVGMRMGALLAWDALHDVEGVSALVLWDPCLHGRQFLREQALLLSAAYGEGQPGEGAAEGPATYYEPETAGALTAYDPFADPVPPAPSVLLLTRQGRSLGKALAPIAEAPGVEAGTVDGQA
ncbi:MAG: alpha/beta hydrolase, partial [Acidimicrobiales bacterium]|nr:alpha/beta hydrolase [Acidimicrobiales bacterium]